MDDFKRAEINFLSEEMKFCMSAIGTAFMDVAESTVKGRERLKAATSWRKAVPSLPFPWEERRLLVRFRLGKEPMQLLLVVVVVVVEELLGFGLVWSIVSIALLLGGCCAVPLVLLLLLGNCCGWDG